MRRLIQLGGVAVVLLCAAPTFAHAVEPASTLDVTIDRALAFLAKDAVAWKQEHQCASCHHAALLAWALGDAARNGHSVDQSVLADMTRWMAESGEGKVSLPRPASAPLAFNSKALYYSLALSMDPRTDSATETGYKTLLGTVKSDQTENGSWQAWPETRPPIFGPSDETTTAMAVLAILPDAAAGDEGAVAARDKALEWLTATKTDDDPQSLALRVVLWTRLNRPSAEWEPWVRRIRERQQVDGGWSQTESMASDAWATGQALYALAHAGVTSADPAIARGHEFLIRTQREDGSWPMTSRPTKPGSEGSTSLIPIVGAGNSWAVIGLVRSK